MRSMCTYLVDFPVCIKFYVFILVLEILKYKNNIKKTDMLFLFFFPG